MQKIKLAARAHGKTHPVLALALAASAAGLGGVGGGCKAMPARVLDAGSQERIVSVDKINIQDFEVAGEDMTASLLSSSAINGTASDPSLLMISRITNNTGENLRHGTCWSRRSVSAC